MLAQRSQRAIVLLALLYCLIEAVYVVRLPLVMDEFDGAYEAYRLRHDVPYRDYIPYKTVAGYYLESIPALLAPTVWSRILAIKLFLVLLNTAMLVAAAFYLSRFFSMRAVAGALLLLVVATNFLERSAELRVDMLTAWAGLWSLLLLLPRRYAAAGAACALSFLVSQKGALYFVAANVAIVVFGLIARNVRETFRAAVRFNIGFALPIAAYVLGWSIIAAPRVVVRSTFLSAAGQALLSAYDIRGHYWAQALARNPIYFGLAAVAMFALLRKPGAHSLVALYAIVIAVEGVAYKQPWPYFFPILLPTFFVAHAAFLDSFPMPRWIVAIIGAGGVLYPLLRVPVVLGRDNAYQRYNVNLASAILTPTDTYLAATDIVHDHEQTLPRLERLDGYNLRILQATPVAELMRIVAQLNARPPKLIVANYRVYNMPRPLTDDFGANYARLSGSILTYAPLFPAGQHTFALPFTGRYRVDAPAQGNFTLDGTAIAAGADVPLAAGPHTLLAQGPVRLRLLPAGIEALLDPDFVDERPFYPNIYDY